MNSPRLTQKDIARQTGFTQATVSLALSNHPSISKETRERVAAEARKMGYAPDPYLSGLSAYRKRTRPAKYQATLAWLSNHGNDFDWKKSIPFGSYHKGASERSGQLGYRLEDHCLRSENMTPQRMARLLRARNISGLLLAPQPEADLSIEFDFKRFSAITFGYTLVKPPLHMVTLHQFRSMKTLFQKLLDLGYQRPGLALANESDRRADRNWSAAFWSKQRDLPHRQRVPLLLGDPLTQDVFTKWFQKYRPDVVVSIWAMVHDWLKAAGEKVPETTGLALLSVPDGGKLFSGIWENPELIGSRAVEFLVDLIHRGECGVPDVPLYQLVDGTWVDGKTLINKNI